MKQRRFGEKVVNWHQPLRQDRFRRRYERRHDIDTQRRIAAHFDPDVADWHWDEDPYWIYENGAYDLDYAIHAAIGLLQKGGGHAQFRALLGQVDMVTDSHASDSTGEKETAQQAETVVPVVDRSDLEERLLAHLQQLAQSQQLEGWLPKSIQQALQDSADLALLRQLANGQEADHALGSIDIMLNLLFFAPFWIRPLATWSPKGEDEHSRAFSLIEHLFTRYPVPKVLFKTWLADPDRMRFKWICWFILLGSGCSLHRAAEHFQWQVPRKFQQYFEMAPTEMQPLEACMYAEILRLGGSAVEYQRLRANPAYTIDPTERSEHLSYLSFWQDTVLWLAKHREAITDQEAHLILTWTMHQYTESERAQETPFTLRGRSVRRVSEESLAFWDAMRRPYNGYSWQAHNLDWEWMDEASTHWSFVELTSGSQLFDEGQALNHCVASYAARCATGYSAIVSLRQEGERRITIEINPRSKKIVQALGLYNRQMQVQENAIVKLWQASILE